MVALLLAAGRGARFAGATHKLWATINGRPVYAWALQHALDAVGGPEIDGLVVVTGAVELALPNTVATVHNALWAQGQMGSLRAGLAAASQRGADAVVVGLADQPFIPSTAWRAVAAADSPIAVATYDGQRANPVRLDRRVWKLLPEAGDEGARSLMRLRPDLVAEVPCGGTPADIDTVEDLERWSSSTNSP